MDSFGSRMKELRIRKGKTQAQMAEDLNTTEATISRYENNKHEPKLDLLKEIAEYLDTSVDYLVGIKDKPEWYDELPPEIQNLIDKNEGLEYAKAIKHIKDKGYKAEHIKNIVEVFEQYEKILRKMQKE